MTAACVLCGQVAYTVVALNPSLIFLPLLLLDIKTISIIAVVAIYPSKMNHLVTSGECAFDVTEPLKKSLNSAL